MKLFNRTRRFHRSHDAKQATTWLATLAEQHADAASTPITGDGHLPALTRDVHVRPGTPFTRTTGRLRPRVIFTVPAGADAPTQQLARVPAPVIPRLPMMRAPQPAAADPRPLQRAQSRPGRTYSFTIPPAPTLAEQLASVWDTAAEQLTRLSGWVYNRGVDDVAVTHNRFVQLRDRYADLLPAPLELAAA